MMEPLFFIIPLILILGITTYYYFKNGNKNKMMDENIEDRLESIFGNELEDGLQDQFNELVKAVCTSITAVNSEYESAVYVFHTETKEFLLQSGSSKKFNSKVPFEIKLANSLMSNNDSRVIRQNEFPNSFNQLMGTKQWSGSECIIGTRITYNDQPVGLVLVYTDHFSKIQDRDRKIIGYNGKFLTLGMSKIDKIETLLTDNYYNSHITKLYKSVDVYSKEEDIYEAVENLCHRFFTYDKLSISFLSNEHKAQIICSDGINDDINVGTEFDIRGSLHGRAILRDEGIRSKNWREDYSEQFRFNEKSEEDYNFSSVLITPIYIKERVKGTLGLERLTSKPFDDSDQKLLELLSSTLGYILSWLKEFQKIHNSSIHDGLTGVLNRKAFVERMEEETNRSNRTHQSLCLIMFDLDKFKRINDTYGHPYGDYVIKTTAQLLKNSVRNIDIVARYGGEEFVVILVDTDKVKSQHVAERMVETISKFDFDYSDIKVRMTISAGMAEFPGDSNEDESLIKIADDALYVSKKLGGNMVSVANGKSS